MSWSIMSDNQHRGGDWSGGTPSHPLSSWRLPSPYTTQRREWGVKSPCVRMGLAARASNGTWPPVSKLAIVARGLRQKSHPFRWAGSLVIS